MAALQPATPASNTREDRRQNRLWPVIYGLLVVLLVAGILWVNDLDVRLGLVRLFYGLLCVWLIVSFFVRRFRSWLSERTASEQSRCHLTNKWLQRIEFGLSVLMLLLALEAGARAMPPMSNSSTSYPGARFVWPTRYARGYEFGRNFSRSRITDDRPQILVLGDSYVEGAGVRTNERFCFRMEKSLRETRPQAQVIAASCCGWNTLDEAEFLVNHGSEVDPDAVIVAYVLNDAEGSGHVALQPSRWELWLQTRLRSYLCYRLFRARRGDSMSQYWKEVQRQHQPDSSSWLAVESALKSIEAWCQERKIPCHLVVLPIFTRDADAGREVTEQVVARAKTLGFHSYHTLDDFDGRWLDFAVSPYDAHPNAAAHQRLAQRIEAELKTVIPTKLLSR
ncbi:MAG: SGNH/GDSL hydrolase family protein [Planctomycetota bacterium]